MSLLLRFKHQNSDRNASVGPKLFSASGPRTSRLYTSRRSLLTGKEEGGRTQVQISQSAQQYQQRSTSQEKEKQQELKSSVTMEEVLQNLKILELQQHQSEQKLENACREKQRQLDHQSELETTLQNLKYQNGKTKAELQRSHDVLSKEQRMLSKAKSTTSTAGDDLRVCDEKLQLLLQASRDVNELEQKCKISKDALLQKAAILIRVTEETKKRVKELESNISAIEEERALHLKLIKHTKIQKESLSLAKARVQTDILGAQEQLARTGRAEEKAKLWVESLSAEETARVLRHEQMLSTLKNDIAQQETEKETTKKRNQAVIDGIADKRKTLHASWQRAIALQKKLGHEQDLPPTETTSPPCLDLKKVRESVDVARKSLFALVTSRDKILASISDLKQQLREQSQKQTVTRGRLEVAMDAARESRDFEEDRESNFKIFLNEYEMITAEVRELEMCHKNNRYKDVDEQDRTVSELEIVRQLSGALRSEISAEARKEASLSKMIADNRDLLSKRETSNMSSLEAIQTQISELQDKLDVLEVKRTTLTAQSRLPPDLDALKSGIAKILKDYPILDTVDFHYAVELTLEQQADRDLVPVIDHCRNRIDSAKKMRRELKEASDRAAKEAKAIKAAKAAAEKRKERDRQRRQDRLKKLQQLRGGKGIKKPCQIDHARRVPSKRLNKAPLLNDDISAAKPRSLLTTFDYAVDHEHNTFGQDKKQEPPKDTPFQCPTEIRKSTGFLQKVVGDYINSPRVFEQKEHSTYKVVREGERAFYGRSYSKQKAPQKKVETSGRPFTALESSSQTARYDSSSPLRRNVKASLSEAKSLTVMSKSVMREKAELYILDRQGRQDSEKNPELDKRIELFELRGRQLNGSKPSMDQYHEQQPQDLSEKRRDKKCSSSYKCEKGERESTSNKQIPRNLVGEDILTPPIKQTFSHSHDETMRAAHNRYQSCKGDRESSGSLRDVSIPTRKEDRLINDKKSLLSVANYKRSNRAPNHDVPAQTRTDHGVEKRLTKLDGRSRSPRKRRVNRATENRSSNMKDSEYAGKDREVKRSRSAAEKRDGNHSSSRFKSIQNARGQKRKQNPSIVENANKDGLAKSAPARRRRMTHSDGFASFVDSFQFDFLSKKV